ncbi:hypothetical protein [Rhizobium leucaenae]|uniref:Uncharacterized protein n=1 Tax=Rhizobium leucaenae TaxID=29450 RepID=A0A7W6ZY75_9HYPH|nr:hypothetical protein [Rhizobium leucaenae]MBB4570937.1 hypothetical protein [Rhizobium leucaenae]MBB6303599.1 hypothetical protein [Rhizobium leucaenae]
MAYTQTDLDMAERHIAEGEQHISDQEMIITKLRIRHLDTEVAEEVLAAFNEMLQVHRHHRDVIAAGLEGDH